MVLTAFFSELSSAAAAAKTIQSLIKNTCGVERALLLELQKNPNLLYLFLGGERQFITIVRKLEVQTYEEAVKTNFDFKELKKSKLNARMVAGIKQFQPYIGWSTEQLLQNIYLKIHQLKSILEIGPENSNYRIGVRLKNLHKLMLLLLKHAKF